MGRGCTVRWSWVVGDRHGAVVVTVPWLGVVQGRHSVVVLGGTEQARCGGLGLYRAGTVRWSGVVQGRHDAMVFGTEQACCGDLWWYRASICPDGVQDLKNRSSVLWCCTFPKQCICRSNKRIFLYFTARYKIFNVHPNHDGIQQVRTSASKEWSIYWIRIKWLIKIKCLITC